MDISKENRRISWVDVCKFFGIFFIYAGHFGDAAGRLTPFAFAFHVPLFFFLSGCMAGQDLTLGFAGFIRKKAERILMPWLVFCFLSACVFILDAEGNAAGWYAICTGILKGSVRNHFFAGSLWFLTALFTMSVLFYLIAKVPNKAAVFVISAGIYYVSARYLPMYGAEYPSLWWNFDSAMQYLIYYCIGYLSFPKLSKMLDSKSRRAVTGKHVIFVISLLYSTFLYFGKDGITLVSGRGLLWYSALVIRALLPVYMVIVLSWFFSDIQIFQRLGRNTLWLCGAEFCIKTIVPSFLSVFGIQVTLRSELSVIVYTVFLLLISMAVFVPLERYVYGKIHAMLHIKR